MCKAWYKDIHLKIWSYMSTEFSFNFITKHWKDTLRIPISEKVIVKIGKPIGGTRYKTTFGTSNVWTVFVSK